MKWTVSAISAAEYARYTKREEAALAEPTQIDPEIKVISINLVRHSEEHSDEAISKGLFLFDEIAALRSQ